jgi:hypothetical protein
VPRPTVFLVSDFDFGDWGQPDGHADFSDGEFLGHFDGDLTDPHGLSVAHEVHEVHDSGAGQYDLAGADPDEEGLWDQLQLDLHDGGNPYAAS